MSATYEIDSRNWQMSQGLSQGFECEVDEHDWICCDTINNGLTIEFISQDDNLGGITIGRDQIQNLIYCLNFRPNTQTSHCFQVVCELDDLDSFSCDLNVPDETMTIVLCREGERLGGISIGRDQIQNLINYLESVKEVV